VIATTHTPITRLFLSHVMNSVPWIRRLRWSRVGDSLNQNGAVSRL